MRTTEIFTAGTRRRAYAVHTLLATAAACSLSACANFTEVISEGDEGSYNLTATGVSYTMSMPQLTAASHQRAVSWCAAQDSDMQLRQQVRGWRPMQVELNFRCLPKQIGQLEQAASLPTFK